MKIPFELTIGLTYTRAGRRGRRKDRFLSFISGMSVASIALGVAALIIVLSVMNGFQKEVRDRMLGVIPHIEITNGMGPMTDWRSAAADVMKNPEVVAAAPYVQGQGLLNSGSVVRGAMVKGIDPETEPGVSDISQHLERVESLDVLKPGSFGILLGRDLAHALRVRPGDRVSMMVPQGSVTPAGLVPRMKQFTVLGYLSSGHYEYDSTMALVNMQDAAALFRTGGPQGLRVRVTDMDLAPSVARSLARTLPPGAYASDWSRQNRTWFAAVQVEKRMMGIILFLIVLVGAFGLVSSLVMTVKEKQADIAPQDARCERGRDHAHLRHPGHDRRHRRRGLRRRIGPARRRERRRDREHDRGDLQCRVPPEVDLLHLRHAVRSEDVRHHSDRALLLPAEPRGHALSELARGPHPACGGTSL